MTTNELLWQQTYDARQALWEQHFGPFPAQVSKLMNLTGVWPGGCLVQIQDEALGGLWVSSSFGLTNSDMPTSVSVARHEVAQSANGARYESTLARREPRKVAAGRAGYGYEVAVLTEQRESWPLMLLSWVVQMELLRDLELLERVEELGAITVEDVRIGEGRSDFLIAQAPAPLPGTFALPSGEGRLLVAIAITHKEMELGLRHGGPALLDVIAASGMGPLSMLGRDSLV